MQFVEFRLAIPLCPLQVTLVEAREAGAAEPSRGYRRDHQSYHDPMQSITIRETEHILTCLSYSENKAASTERCASGFVS